MSNVSRFTWQFVAVYHDISRIQLSDYISEETVLLEFILNMSSSIELINPKAESVRRAAALQVFVL